MFIFPEKFQEFISLDCDRQRFIQSYLEQNGVSTAIIQVDDKNHIHVNFPQSQYNPTFKIKTLIAHYDRVSETPGANDNSMAVFTLMNWAINLVKNPLPIEHNIRLIFTDGEELAGDGVASQGAYALAKHFKRLNITKDDIFVFDCMGRGNVPILCENFIPNSAGADFFKRYTSLEKRAEKILQSVSDKWMKLPASYSDNAGFLAMGIPAVALTMLPSKEAENYLYLTIKYGNKKPDSPSQDSMPEYKEDFKKLFPPTWLMLHSKFDDYNHLSAESQDVMIKILDSLARLKTLNQ